MTRKFVRLPVEEYHALLTQAGQPIPPPKPRAKRTRPEEKEPWRTIFAMPLEKWRDAAPPWVRSQFSALAIKVSPMVLAQAIMDAVEEERAVLAPVTLEDITRRMAVANGGWA
jgi:hypothetical protein